MCGIFYKYKRLICLFLTAAILMLCLNPAALKSVRKIAAWELNAPESTAEDTAPARVMQHTLPSLPLHYIQESDAVHSESLLYGRNNNISGAKSLNSNISRFILNLLFTLYLCILSAYIVFKFFYTAQTESKKAILLFIHNKDGQKRPNLL